MECLVQSDPPKRLLLPFVFPLTVVLCATKSGPSHQMASELLAQVNKKGLPSDTTALMGSTEFTAVPTSTSELYSEICATAELYCQLCRYALLLCGLGKKSTFKHTSDLFHTPNHNLICG